MDRHAFVADRPRCRARHAASRSSAAKKEPLIGYVGYGTPGSDPAGIAGRRDGRIEETLVTKIQ